MQSVVPVSSDQEQTTLSFVQKTTPLFGAIGLLGIMFGCIFLVSLKRNGGVFTYGRDDAYIHMSIAKNLVLHHVWGVTAHTFVSASSSLLWTALVAASYRLFGIGDMAPLVLNLISAIALLVLIFKLLEREGLNQVAIMATLFAVVFVMPLPYLLLDGMEPVLHTLLTIWFLYAAGEVLSSEGNEHRETIALAILAPLLVAARFEGLFLLILTAGLFVLRRRFSFAMLLLALGTIPILIIGIPSMLHGGWILPNSVMLKGNRPYGSLLEWAAHLPIETAANLFASKALCLIATLVVVALYFSADRRNLWRAQSLRLALYSGILLAHLAFARVGRPFRYEAYLVVTGIYLLATCLKEPWFEALIVRVNHLWERSPVATAVVALLILSPLATRGLDGTFRAAGASHNCFEQQYQMARFARRFYQGQTLVLNDIGFVSYLADINLVDIMGLGSTEVARSYARWNAEVLGSIAHEEGAKIAIVYQKWLPGVPSGWTRIGEWRLNDVRYALGGLTVAFFAIDPSEADALRANLVQFDAELPSEVTAHLEAHGHKFEGK